MNAAEARATLKVVGEDEGELTASERRVALEYFSGPNAGNKVQSYLAVFPDATYGTASVEAGELLKQPRVKAFLDRLHQEVIDDAVVEMRPWSELLGLAKAVILGTIQGRLRSRLCYEAAVYVVNRCEGMPSQTLDLFVASRQKVEGATQIFMDRVAEERRRSLGAPGQSGQQRRKRLVAESKEV